MQKIVTTTAKIQKFHTIPCKEVPRKCTVSADSGTNRQKICRDGAPSHPPPLPPPPPKKNIPKNHAKLSHWKICLWKTAKNTKYISFFFFRYIAERWCKSNEVYLSNVFFTKSIRTFITFPWFDTIFKFV